MRLATKALLGLSVLIGVTISSMVAHAQGNYDGGDYVGGCCDTPFKRLNRTQPPTVQKAAAILYDELLKKSYKEIVLLEIDDDSVCKSISCRGIPESIAKKYIDAALLERQIDDNAKINMISAEAAYFSSRVALVGAITAVSSLLAMVVFGVLTHRRDKRRDDALMSPRRGAHG
jgi:hypothetical protein